MVSIEQLKEYSENLMFKMDEKEYETLSCEFEVFLNWMDHIGQIEGLEKIEPMYFPYDKEDITLRKDEPVTSLSKEDIIKNAKVVKDNSIVVPKVVG